MFAFGLKFSGPFALFGWGINKCLIRSTGVVGVWDSVLPFVSSALWCLLLSLTALWAIHPDLLYVIALG
jgi:hypothetical protein